ncbi:hypothetical protein ACHHYP_13111 [Achlya hypogyna]|uniref:Uncharacterized protein n=1 Tax=Achlya hypogyna TaxID=1202772 RepID=A0A1V9YFX4_ACHHY|nr:hypothetical protein ACHHYP_13111 [Achlya hypogyna]
MDTSDHGDVSATRLERKRIRDRRAKQAARRRFLDEYSVLQDTISSMTTTLETMTATRKVAFGSHCILGWRDVARSLAASKDESLVTRRSLQRRLAQNTRLIQSLYTWVASMAPQHAIATPEYAWKDVHLSADTDLRAIGLNWIAQQMLHATSLQVPNAVFPTALEDAIHGEWGLQGGKIYVQLVLDATVVEAATTGWAFSQALPTIIHECRGGITNLHHVKTTSSEVCYNREEFPDRVTNGLYTCFVEPDRVVTHYRTVRNDAAYPIPTKMTEDIQEWNVIRPISPTKCVIRSTHVYQPFKAYESMAAYADDISPSFVAEATAQCPATLDDEIARRFVSDTCAMMAGMNTMFRKLLLKVQATPEAYPCPF